MRIVLIGLLLTAASAAHASSQYIGYAYDLETGELVYTETHVEQPTGGDAVRLEPAGADGGGA